MAHSAGLLKRFYLDENGVGRFMEIPVESPAARSHANSSASNLSSDEEGASVTTSKSKGSRFSRRRPSGEQEAPVPGRGSGKAAAGGALADPAPDSDSDVILEVSDDGEGEEGGADPTARSEHGATETPPEDLVAKPGDYQVRVRIIEVRDLKPRGESSCSPVAEAEVRGEKQHTQTAKHQNSAVLDTQLTFTFPNLSEEDVEGSSITLRVLDAGAFGLSKLLRQFVVGEFTLDMMSVYRRPRHEMHRQWVGLARSGEAGPSGYMKCSVLVLGPGDVQPQHNLEEDLKREQLEEAAGGVGGSAMMPPSLDQALQLLVITVYGAEGLPPMDRSVLSGKTGIDAYVKLQFAGGLGVRGKKGTKTKTVPVMGRGKNVVLGVRWNEQIVLPVVVPAMTDRVLLSVWDHDRFSDDDLVCYATPISFQSLEIFEGFGGESTRRLKHIKAYNNAATAQERSAALARISSDASGAAIAMPGGLTGGAASPDYTPPQPMWLNLYGPPRETPDNEHSRRMRTVASAASTYAGRLLVSAHREGDLPGAKGGVLDSLGSMFGSLVGGGGRSARARQKVRREANWGKGIRGATFLPHRRVVANLQGGETMFMQQGAPTAVATTADSSPMLRSGPPTARYTLRVIMARGALLPLFRRRLRQASPLGVEVVVAGRRCMVTKMVPAAADGSVEWAELNTVELDWGDPAAGGVDFLPEDPKQIPDVFVYLVKGKAQTRVCYLRLSASELLQREEERASRTKGDVRLHWHMLNPDPVVGKVDQNAFPGSLLMRVALFRQSSAGTSIPRPVSSAGSTFAAWQTGLTQIRSRRRYRIDVHIFQARRLPAADDDGSIDPYLKISYGHERHTVPKQQSQGVSALGSEVSGTHFVNNTDPLINETVVFGNAEDQQLELSQDPEYCRDLMIEVWDWDQLSSDDPCGAVRVPLRFARWVSKGQSYPRVQDMHPSWWRVAVNSADTSGLPLARRKTRQQLNQEAKRVHVRTSSSLAHDELLTSEEEDDTGPGLLLAVVVVPLDGATAPLLPPPSIAPSTEEKYVKVLPLGCRSLHPLSVFAPIMPSVEISIGGGAVVSTVPSNKPHARSPSYPGKPLLLPFRCPVDAQFAPSLSITVRDRCPGTGRIFGARTLGRTSFDLTRRLKHTNGEHNPYFSDGNDDEPEDVEDESKGDTLATGTASDHVSENPRRGGRRFMRSFLGQLSSSGAAASREGKGVEDDSSGDDDEEHIKKELGNALYAAPQPYTKRRLRLGESLPQKAGTSSKSPGCLEDVADLNPPLFASLPIFDGQGLGRRQVGIFKCTIAVVDARDEVDASSGNSSQEQLEEKLKKREEVYVRLYVLDATDLMPMDPNGLSDPYLKVILPGGGGKSKGGVLYDGRKDTRTGANAVFERTLAPQFHVRIDTIAQLPGPSQLKIEVWDWDRFSHDDLIGSTVIDLEDRWFDQRWRDMDSRPRKVRGKWAQVNAAGGSDAFNDASERILLRGSSDASVRAGAEGLAADPRFNCPTKPLESRTLDSPTSQNPQGSLRVWLDLLTAEEHKRCPPHDVSLPAPEEFEVRVVIWKTKGVRPGDPGSGMTDMYLTAWLGKGMDAKAKLSTDTHFRCNDGRGSFNWRMKFPLKLPLPRADAEGALRLTLQVWDKDILEDDMVGKVVINLIEADTVRNGKIAHNLKVAAVDHTHVSLLGAKQKTRREAEKSSTRYTLGLRSSSKASGIASGAKPVARNVPRGKTLQPRAAGLEDTSTTPLLAEMTPARSQFSSDVTDSGGDVAAQPRTRTPKQVEKRRRKRERQEKKVPCTPALYCQCVQGAALRRDINPRPPALLPCRIFSSKSSKSSGWPCLTILRGFLWTTTTGERFC